MTDGDEVRIRELDAQTVERIAAGEVVERPASVVKELVENSLDAGADRVAVAVERGGKEGIRVTDDGTGMTEPEVRKAVEKHTTSKISDIDDLAAGVATLGFRGEALHAIGAVSRLTIRTRPHDAADGRGTELRVEGGEVTAVEPAGCPAGTAVEVADLFYNVPARRKYLKQAGTEFAHVNDVVTAYALANPDVRVSLEHDGRETFATTGQGDLQSAVMSVYGREVATAMVPVEPDDDEAVTAADLPDGPLERVAGLVSHPETNRANNDYVTTYVNGRYVRSAAVRDAIVDAYGSQLAGDRFPFAVLFLSVPGDAVDVNVHPRKYEIRFADEDGVREQVESAVRSALLRAGLVRSGAPRGRSAPEETDVRPEQSALTDDPAAAADAGDGADTPAAADARDGADTPDATDATGDSEGVDAAGEGEGAGATGEAPSTGSGSTEPEPTEGSPIGPGDIRGEAGASGGRSASGDRPASAGGPASPGSPAGGETGDGEVDDETGDGETDDGTSDGETDDGSDPGGGPDGHRPGRFHPGTAQTRLGDGPAVGARGDRESFDRLPSLRVLGQFDETYLVAESEDGLVLVDQHAADERINYERLREQVAGGTTTQALADPVRLSLTAREAALLAEYEAALARLGFRVDLPGGGADGARVADDDAHQDAHEEHDDGGPSRTVTVRTVPALVAERAGPDLVRDVLGAFVTGERAAADTVDAAVDDLLADLACYPSLTGNTSLTEGTALDLLRRLDGCENPWACPHGRPVVVELERGEIEARFERDYPGHDSHRGW